MRNYIPGFEENIVMYGIISDLVLAISLFVLGGEFLAKLSALLIPGATAKFTWPEALAPVVIQAFIKRSTSGSSNL